MQTAVAPRIRPGFLPQHLCTPAETPSANASVHTSSPVLQPAPVFLCRSHRTAKPNLQNHVRTNAERRMRLARWLLGPQVLFCRILQTAPLSTLSPAHKSLLAAAGCLVPYKRKAQSFLADFAPARISFLRNRTLAQ